MKTEFTTACISYYRLAERLAKQQLHFETLLSNALPYTGQTELAELDRIISCNRKIQAARADAEKTEAGLHEAREQVLQIMQYFEIPPSTRLKAEIPGLI